MLSWLGACQYEILVVVSRTFPKSVFYLDVTEGSGRRLRYVFCRRKTNE